MAKNTGGAKKTGTGLLDFVTNVAATVKETVESAIETTVNGVGNYREGFNKRYKNPILASLYEIIYLSKNEEIELKAVQFLAQLFEHTKKIDDKIKDEIAKFISDNSSILYTNTKVRASTKEIKQYFDTFREDIKEFKNYMLSIENSEHKTILQYLIEQGNLEALRVLCSTKNDFNKAEADKNAFFDAFKKEENNREEIFEILVKSSIDPNIKNKNGLTVLHLAVMGGCIKIIKLLLSMRDIDVNVQDNDGLTPLLHILVELIIRDQNAEKKFDNREHLESFALLVKRTNVNILLDHKNILFHIMAIKNPVLDSQLLKHVLSNEKIDLNVTIRKSTSLLHYAIADVNSLPYCMLLLERGARTDLMDEDGYLPIHRAVEYGFVEAAEAIITHDQNLAHKNSEYKESYKVLTKSGQNCLYIAAEKGFIKIIEVLLKKD
ncbi:MAG: ankyrin repeat domain-containing protein, partial [Methanobacterium sp.]